MRNQTASMFSSNSIFSLTPALPPVRNCTLSCNGQSVLSQCNQAAAAETTMLKPAVCCVLAPIYACYNAAVVLHRVTVSLTGRSARISSCVPPAAGRMPGQHLVDGCVQNPCRHWHCMSHTYFIWYFMMIYTLMAMIRMPWA